MSDASPDDIEIRPILDEADAVLAKYRDKSPVPELVFHYTTLDTGFKIVDSNTVWCSNLRYSNDPSEATYGDQLIDEVASKDPDLKLQGARSVISELETYAASFSAEGDLLPQWRAYCRNGRGVSIGVPFDVLRKRKSMYFSRVLYERAEQVQFIQDFLDVFRVPVLAARFHQARLALLVEKLALYLAMAKSLLKSPAYESEREYRLLDILPFRLSVPHAGLLFRPSGGALVPYLVADLSASHSSLAPQCIAQLRVGPCLDERLISSAFALYGDQKNRSIPVARSSVSMRCE